VGEGGQGGVSRRVCPSDGVWSSARRLERGSLKIRLKGLPLPLLKKSENALDNDEERAIAAMR
jgi:hypothetical protein